MKLASLLRYIPEGVTGYLTAERRQPKISDDEIIADLHCHPRINSLDDFLDTARVCRRNKVGLCAIVEHFNCANPHESQEMDYWSVLDIVKQKLPITISDDELCFEYENVKFIGGYEFSGILKGVKGHLDIVPLMLEKGFKERIKEGSPVKEALRTCQAYNGITIGAHPYTLWDPWMFGKIPFRLADNNEREIIKKEWFPLVHSVDLVASNAFWMAESNKLVKKDYDNPLCTSDTHSKRRSMRKEIGRAGTIFKRKDLNGDLKFSLGTAVRLGYFRTYEAYMPALNFLVDIAL